MLAAASRRIGRRGAVERAEGRGHRTSTKVWKFRVIDAAKVPNANIGGGRDEDWRRRARDEGAKTPDRRIQVLTRKKPGVGSVVLYRRPRLPTGISPWRRASAAAGDRHSVMLDAARPLARRGFEVDARQRPRFMYHVLQILRARRRADSLPGSEWWSDRSELPGALLGDPPRAETDEAGPGARARHSEALVARARRRPDLGRRSHPSGSGQGDRLGHLQRGARRLVRRGPDPPHTAGRSRRTPACWLPRCLARLLGADDLEALVDEDAAVAVAALAPLLGPESAIAMPPPARLLHPPCAYPFSPPKSTITQASSPTVQASCPGGMLNASPGLYSCSEPSSMRTVIRPDRT